MKINTKQFKSKMFQKLLLLMLLIMIICYILTIIGVNQLTVKVKPEETIKEI